MKYNIWVNDCGWLMSGNMPMDHGGVSLAEAKHEYCELVKEYATDALMILPAELEICDADEFGALGGMYYIKKAR